MGCDDFNSLKTYQNTHVPNRFGNSGGICGWSRAMIGFNDSNAICLLFLNR